MRAIKTRGDPQKDMRNAAVGQAHEVRLDQPRNASRPAARRRWVLMLRLLVADLCVLPHIGACMRPPAGMPPC